MTHILLVDDENIQRDIIEMFLIKSIKIPPPLHFYHAKNGNQAIRQVVEHEELDFIIMDITMPDCNGIEATKLIRKINKKVLIYACTAEHEDIKKECLEAGMNGFFTKPFKTDYGIKINWEIFNKV